MSSQKSLFQVSIPLAGQYVCNEIEDIEEEFEEEVSIPLAGQYVCNTK